MGLAIGTVELNSVASGIAAGDAMLKAAEVRLIMAQPVCPGKYVLIAAGDTSSVETAVRAGEKAGRDKVVDTTLISSIAQEVIPAIMRTTAPEQKEAVGVIETFSLASAILAADYAVKSAAVELIEIRLGRGLGGNFDRKRQRCDDSSRNGQKAAWRGRYDLKCGGYSFSARGDVSGSSIVRASV